MAIGKKSKAAFAPNGDVSYLGQHLRDLDAGRVILPSDWRSENSPRDFMILVWPPASREYLLVLPPARWEVLQRNLLELSLGDEEAALVERMIGSNTFKRSMDSYGRLPLPEEACAAVGIEKQALLSGRMNKFEIWNRDRLTAHLAKPDAQSIEKTLKSIKI